MDRKRVLLGSPIRQKPAILKEFLHSLNELDVSDITLDFLFVDDNEEAESVQMLSDFGSGGRAQILKAGDLTETGDSPAVYLRNDATHYWKEQLIWRVAGFKDRMIAWAKEQDYDALFLVDSDLVLHPQTIRQLICAEKDIISEIFWTSWVSGSREMPNAWLYDHYDMARRQRGETLTPEKQAARQADFLAQLKIPGVYEVGGLGACTLISRKALQAGVNFKVVKNLTLWGEDRHFCVRACALGLDLFVDTHYPPYHIYRDSLLAGVEDYWTGCGKYPALPRQPDRPEPERKAPRLTLSMVVKNEADRYLARVLREHKNYIDQAVIINDGSTDNSKQICQEILKDIPYNIISNSVSKFPNEVELRKQQWRETVAADPDWILCLDADELFESRFRTEVRNLISDPEICLYYFRLYDLWDENHYREDQYWHSQDIYRPFLLKYRPGFIDEWHEIPQHCGRFPKNIFELPNKRSDLRLKHLGWMDPKDRLAKYQRYRQFDQGFGWKEQYESILDPNPNLREWTEP